MPIINETYEVIEHQCYKKTLKFVTKLNNHNLILEQIHPMSWNLVRYRLIDNVNFFFDESLIMVIGTHYTLNVLIHGER